MTLETLWGKARPGSTASNGMHPLTAHSLDVAAVAVLLPGPTRIGLDRRILAALVALHDIGKVSRAFQAMSPKHWPAAVLGPAPTGGVPGYPHDAMGLHLMKDVVGAELDRLLPRDRGWRPGLALHLQRALAGHHGRPAALNRTPTPEELGEPAAAAARGLVGAMLNLFRPPPLPAPPERAAVRLGWQLAGLTTLADWIGSRQRWFPYVPAEAAADPAAYWFNHALPRAAAAVAAAGLGAAPVARFEGVRRLFPGIARPTPVQDWAETVRLPDGPVLAVIEDLTGSGKTEAAVALAHRLMGEGRVEGVFLALPTMATANAMFGRLSDAYRGLFAASARPSLALAHGRAALDPRFAAAIGPDDRDIGHGRPDPADEPAEAHCAAWLAEDGRRALLAQVGVGTVDQALLSVLPVRHAALRQAGLSGKVLIVDEAHAYDAYMTRELRALLRFHAALGGSAILLSATLPARLRGDLVNAFREGLRAPPAALTCTAYPLATLAGAGTVSETPCAPREGLPRRVAVARLPDAAAAEARIVAAAEAGAAVAWVRNTVDDAIAAAAALRARGLDVMLFHARFAMADRLAVEEAVLRRWGRDGDPAARKGVLVATQVVEQSLDLDFDLLCTDLAPADLLIQRAGRLWRHAREGRPIPGPEMLVVSPEPVAEPAADWIKAALPGTAAVYPDPALLWRTARATFARGAIATPEDMRPLVETAYDADAEGAVPPALARRAGEAEAKGMAAGATAAQNVLDVWKGYDRAVGLWEPDTRTPTRLEDQPTVTLRLAVVRDGAVVPYAARSDDDDPRRAWALSEVSVARHRVASCPVPAGLEAAAEKARTGWGRWERESDRHLLAVVQADGDRFRIAAAREDGAATTLIYAPDLGLRFEDRNTPTGA